MDVLSNLDLIDRSQINFYGKCSGADILCASIVLNNANLELRSCTKNSFNLNIGSEFSVYFRGGNVGGTEYLNKIFTVGSIGDIKAKSFEGYNVNGSEFSGYKFNGTEFEASKISSKTFKGTEFEASSKISSKTVKGCTFEGESFKFVSCNGIDGGDIGKIFSDYINFSDVDDSCLTYTKCALIIQSNDGSCGVYPILIQNGSDTDTKHNNILLDEWCIYINSKCSTFINSDTSIELNSNDTKFSVDNNVVRIDNSPLLFYKGDAGLDRYIDFGTYESDTTSLFCIQIKDASQTKRLPLITFNTATSNQCSHVTNIVIAHDGTIDKTEFVAFRSDIPTVNHLEFANPIIPQNCSLYEVSLAPTTFTKTPIMQLTNKSGAAQVADLCYDKTSNKVFVGIDHDAQIAAGEYNLTVFGM